MNELELPEQLKGPWHHDLVLTYSLDIPFFENALRGQLAARCRNQIILADGRRYLEACASYARGGLVRYLNQRYVAEGIFAPRAAHAKLILLTNPERGRLLVGSGNLNWQGYASGGELFTQYEYTADAPAGLNAFLAVRELIEGLVERRYISAPAEKRIRHLWEKTPWLFQSPTHEWQPVRHNLQRSFLDQLQQVVGDEPVEELWVLSPFFDKELVALERLLTVLSPQKSFLLMQPGCTSVDPKALRATLDRYGDRCQSYAFSKGDDSPYVHAKLYLLRLPDRAICLQGSPNLSQVAMLLTVPQGNVELANLFTGPRHAFDDLLDALDIQPVVDLDTLDLSYQSTQPSTAQPSDGWRLTGGEWHEDWLFLGFQGALPDLKDASLVIAHHLFPLDVHAKQHQTLELKLSLEAVGLLKQAAPVAVRWREQDNAFDSNPVFVCNRAALANELQISAEDETLRRVGDLDLDDEEFERLLGELGTALLIDRRSVWQVAGRTPPSTTDEDDEALRLDYAGIDYDLLRQHPKIRQYMAKGATDLHYARSRLQIILNSITDHFRGLLDAPESAQIFEAVARMTQTEEGEGGTEEERDEEEAGKQRRRHSQARRVARILKNFIRRYLRGIQSPDFQELVGFEVIAQNYEIFSHILWRLFAKDWVEPEFVIESLLQTWGFFWGNNEQAGYFKELDLEQQTQVCQWVRDYHADAELLAALYYSAYLTHIEQLQELRFALRDFWREFLRHPPLEITAEMLEETWRIVGHLFPYQPPRPTTILDELTRLAQFETPRSILHAIEKRHRFPNGTCSFKSQSVWREPLQRSDHVKCLFISADKALKNKAAAVAVLRDWMRFESLDYYRVHAPAGERLLYYEGLVQQGLYWTKEWGEMELDCIVPSSTDWDKTLSKIRDLAAYLDTQSVFAPVREEEDAAKRSFDPR